jgi:hypothetical protein
VAHVTAKEDARAFGASAFLVVVLPTESTTAIGDEDGARFRSRGMFGSRAAAPRHSYGEFADRPSGFNIWRTLAFSPLPPDKPKIRKGDRLRIW